MEFQERHYTLNQANDLWQFFDGSEPGEYTYYYDQCVFNTGKGFVAAYTNDLSNYWNV